jgi:tripartite-type tricarboxylate transporter receptor subunit TctC
VAYPPGGVSDVVARALAEQLALRLGTSVLVENRAGASGTLAVNAVAKSAADGYTLVFSALSPLTLSPHLGHLPYDPLKDLMPVASVMVSPVLLAATPALPQGDFKALLTRARQHPGHVRWATSGNGSLGHLILESMASNAQVQMTHVPYKGGGQQITDGLGGQFEILSVNTSGPILQHVREGKLRALAVGAPARLEALPQTPTLTELGFAQANLSSRFGLFAPAGTPATVLDTLNSHINALLALPAMRERLQAAECVPAPASLTELARIVAAEHQNMGAIVRDGKIKAD